MGSLPGAATLQGWLLGCARDLPLREDRTDGVVCGQRGPEAGPEVVIKGFLHIA